jgi:hypothetical protein
MAHYKHSHRAHLYKLFGVFAQFNGADWYSSFFIEDNDVVQAFPSDGSD